MRALVLAGGGSNGDFEIGVCEYLMLKEGRTYDAYLGISTGALSAAFLAQYPDFMAAKAIRDLKNVYFNLKNNSSVYKKWFLWPLSLLWHKSVYDATPLHKIVRKGLSADNLKASGHKLVVGAVELGGDREYRTFTQDHPQIVEAVLGSSAFPVAFQPIFIDGKWWSDGGLRNTVPLKDAIALGATDIDVVLTSPADPTLGDDFDYEKANLFNVLIEATSAMVDQITLNDILVKDVDLAKARNDDPNYKKLNIRVFRPSRYLGDSLSFGADKKPTHRENIALGLADAMTQAKCLLLKPETQMH